MQILLFVLRHSQQDYYKTILTQIPYYIRDAQITGARAQPRIRSVWWCQISVDLNAV